MCRIQSLLMVLVVTCTDSYRWVCPVSSIRLVDQTAHIVSSYAYSQIRFLSLPISQALGLFTVVLPLITGISTQGAYGLIQRFSRREDYQLTIPLIAVIGFQLIYETIIATLAMTYILPPSALACGLDQRWQLLYAQKNEKAIRTIQDSLDCCGLNSVVDRAFPFSGGRSKCAEIYGRNKSCFADWRKAEQTNAGLFLLVASVVFLIKVLFFSSEFQKHSYGAVLTVLSCRWSR
jgi:hypothetical protein